MPARPPAFFFIFSCIYQKIVVILQRKIKTLVMDKPVFIQYNTPEERAAAFRRMIHLREEWEEHIRQVKAAKQMA